MTEQPDSHSDALKELLISLDEIKSEMRGIKSEMRGLTERTERFDERFSKLDERLTTFETERRLPEPLTEPATGRSLLGTSLFRVLADKSGGLEAPIAAKYIKNTSDPLAPISSTCISS